MVFRLFGLIILLVSVFGIQPINAQKIDFDRDIRPILSNHCYACHGPDAETREADLRLDQRAHLFADRDKPLVTAGNPRKSILVQRIASKDEDYRMPPADFLKPISQKQIDLITRWVSQGAEWKDHWAWTTPERPEPPAAGQ